MEEKTKPGFPGGELIRASKGLQRDILSLLLEPDKTYTEAAAAKLVEGFMKKEAHSNGRR